MSLLILVDYCSLAALKDKDKDGKDKDGNDESDDKTKDVGFNGLNSGSFRKSFNVRQA